MHMIPQTPSFWSLDAYFIFGIQFVDCTDLQKNHFLLKLPMIYEIFRVLDQKMALPYLVLVLGIWHSNLMCLYEQLPCEEADVMASSQENSFIYLVRGQQYMVNQM